MSRLLVLGAGGFARAVAEAAQTAGHEVVGFVDDRWPDAEPIWGLPVLGRLADLTALHAQADAVVPAIGQGRARQAACELALRAGFTLANVVHPQACVSPRALLGDGLVVLAGAIIGTEARVGRGAIVNAGAVVDHHAQIGAYAHLSVGACMGGGAVLGSLACLPAGQALATGQRLDDPGTAPSSGH